MEKVLFLIHDLGPGGAEKVLVNLVNNMDRERYDITVMSIFDTGVNRQYIAPHVHFKYCFKNMFRGNSHIMKLLSPKQLHSMLIKDKYDIEVAYLEGPCARIISGCVNPNTKLFSWIHIEQHNAQRAAISFRSIKEAEDCYNSFDRINCVSESVMKDFIHCINIQVPIGVVYNTNESEKIKILGGETVSEIGFSKEIITLVSVGKLLKSKGFDRLIKIISRLKNEDCRIRLLILGCGEEQQHLQDLITELKLENDVLLLGYQTNPYKFVAKSDLFVCASFREGFSTAATEALILGVPVCTVEVAGMKEMLGQNNEYGVVVSNDDKCLYQAIKELIKDKEYLAYYRNMAKQRGVFFSLEKTVNLVQEVLKGEL